MYEMIGVELRSAGRFSSNIEDSFAYVSYSSKDVADLQLWYFFRAIDENNFVQTLNAAVTVISFLGEHWIDLLK